MVVKSGAVVVMRKLVAADDKRGKHATVMYYYRESKLAAMVYTRPIPRSGVNTTVGKSEPREVDGSTSRNNTFIIKQVNQL
ncbi:Hypothetical predicted protein [Octopus vulgaris]|uniref:Uncharacterized protein n=1 Tax=Octopus vulgaris TaxID=6645 RepID=A0AA36AR87_OCTVU|nr:Hypothetical predicted protein [Octopus vulgaris]